MEEGREELHQGVAVEQALAQREDLAIKYNVMPCDIVYYTMCVSLSLYIYIYTYNIIIYTYIYISMYINVYLSISLSLYIYIYICC